MAIERIKLNLIPAGTMPVCHAKQYDKKRQIGIDIYNGLQPYILSDELLELDVRKPDGHIVTIDVPYTAGRNGVVFETTEQMCAVSGDNLCELKITKGEVEIGSLNFSMEIEKSPLEGGLPSDSDIENLRTQMQAIAQPMLDDLVPPMVETLVPEVVGDDYYNKTEINNIVGGINSDLEDIGHDIDNLETDLENKANANEVEAALEGKADQNDLETLENTVNGLADEIEALDQNKADKSDTYTQEQVNNIVSDAIYDVLPSEVASGSVANFETDLALPIKSLEVDVNAVQESGTPTPQSPKAITGVSAVNVTQCGKNLFDVNNITLLEVASGSRWGYSISKAGTYKASVSYDGSAFLYCVIKAADGTFGSNIYLQVDTNNTPRIITVNEGETLIFYNASANQTEALTKQKMSNAQIEVGTTTTEHEPYNGTTEVINLGGTYYGGHFTQDKAGHRQFVVTHSELLDMGNLEWRGFDISNNIFRVIVPNCKEPVDTSDRKNGFLCSIYPPSTTVSINANMTDKSMLRFGGYLVLRDTSFTDYTEIASAVRGQKLIYELATPIVIDLPDGEPIITLNGTNNIYADTGDCAVEYKVSVEQYVSDN